MAFMCKFKRLSFVLLLAMMDSSFFSLVADRGLPVQKSYKVQWSKVGANSHRLVFSLNGYSLNSIHQGGESYLALRFEGGVRTSKKGFAELPYASASLQLPWNSNCKVLVEDENSEDIVLSQPLLPSRGVIYRNQNPEHIPYVIAKESLEGPFYPAKCFESTPPYLYRDVKGVNVYFYPFQYQAKTKTLRVVHRLVLRLDEVEDGAFAATRARETSRPSEEMHRAYQSLFVNFESEPTRWPNEVREMGDMLVITPPAYRNAIAPYVAWKREKGFKVKVVEVPVGTLVKSLVQQEYNSNPRLLYVQLVGDWAHIQSELGTTQKTPMDPMLGCVAGNDNYPDLIVGRFSAASEADVTAQVNKSIAYEKTPDMTEAWYKKAILIASSDGVGQGDDGESDIQHETSIRNTRLSPFGYTDFMSAFGDGSLLSGVVSGFNSGASLVNYTGHGTTTSWSTTSFDTNTARALTNRGRLPVVCSVACVVGDFRSDCLAEALLRNPNGGAIAGMFSTMNQPWQPPMRGQDYFNDMLVGGHQYSQGGTSTANGKTTFGAIAANACVLMYAESSQSGDLETLSTWTTFGDASLQVRNRLPQNIVLSNENPEANSFATTIKTFNGTPVSGAMVCLSQGELNFVGTTDSAGTVTLAHSLSGRAKLVVSGPNLATFYKDVVIIAASTSSLSLTSQPQSQQVESGQMVVFSAAVHGGVAPYTYQWFKNGIDMSITQSEYRFIAQTSDNGSQIYVVVKDGLGGSITSSSALLSVGGADATQDIINNDFELNCLNWKGATWTIGQWLGLTNPAHGGSKCAWMGGRGYQNTEMLINDKTYSIPQSATSAQISFYVRVESSETSRYAAYDTLELVIIQNGQVVMTPFQISNLAATGKPGAGSYVLKSCNLLSLRGKTFQIGFKAKEDESLMTSFMLDDIKLSIQ